VKDELRTVMYRLLGYAFTYPDAEFTSRLRDLLGKTHLDIWGNDELPLAALLREVKSLEEVPLDQLQGEYTRLFISNYPHLPCPPYESAYRERTLMGRTAEAVHDLYQRWGLEVEGRMADHAGAELEFMAFLTGLPQDGETAAAQRAFLREHLLTWLPRLATDLEQHARQGFYRALARLLTTFLAQEKERLLAQE